MLSIKVDAELIIADGSPMARAAEGLKAEAAINADAAVNDFLLLLAHCVIEENENASSSKLFSSKLFDTAHVFVEIDDGCVKEG